MHHDKTGETIPLILGGVGEGATWEAEEVMSFRGTSIREKVLR